ncbi:hypothetical protein [Benzoatithermus flavus]|uniref:Thiol:disulfide interchange protein DsbD N-terminal domain-containing protein n=1 Tax=Benzoatithermus flavus TaxID=3108223 RepID=A0ABU8XR05_9PROT
MTRFRPARSVAVLALVATSAVGSAARAAEPLDALLDRLAPRKTPQGSVEVTSWIERGDGGSELVVQLVPKGQVKLVADPGVTVTPLPREGIAWSADAPVSEVDPNRDYFATPPTLRVPFSGGDGKPVEAAVEYAYCLVDYQCLFGETRVSAPTQP